MRKFVIKDLNADKISKNEFLFVKLHINIFIEDWMKAI